MLLFSSALLMQRDLVHVEVICAVRMSHFAALE